MSRKRRSFARPRRRPGPGLIVLAALAVLLLAALLVRRPGDPALFPAPADQPTVTVYLVDNGVHSNLALPTAALRARGGAGAAALERIGPSPWVMVGWGDARFYVETGMSPARALDGLRALFAPNNPSVVMMEPLRAAPDRLWSSGVLKLELSPEGFARLTRRLDRSFALEHGAPVGGPARGWGDAHFFRSVETFSIAHTCNHWTAELLNAAGVPVRPLLAVTASGLAWDLRGRASTLDTAAVAR